MANDKAVQNQKVFVTLASVLELAKEYERTVAEVTNKASSIAIMVRTEEQNAEQVKAAKDSLTHWNWRKRALEYVIDTLSLPIQKH